MERVNSKQYDRCFMVVSYTCGVCSDTVMELAVLELHYIKWSLHLHNSCLFFSLTSLNMH